MKEERIKTLSILKELIENLRNAGSSGEIDNIAYDIITLDASEELEEAIQYIRTKNIVDSMR